MEVHVRLARFDQVDQRVERLARERADEGLGRDVRVSERPFERPGVLREVVEERDHGTVLVGAARVDVALEGVSEAGRGDLVPERPAVVAQVEHGAPRGVGVDGRHLARARELGRVVSLQAGVVERRDDAERLGGGLVVRGEIPGRDTV